MTGINSSEIKSKNNIVSFWEFEKNRIKKLKDFILGIKNNDFKESGICDLVYQTYKNMNKDCKSLYHKIIFLNVITALLLGLRPFIDMFLYSSLPELAKGTQTGMLSFIFYMSIYFIYRNFNGVFSNMEVFNKSKLRDLYKRYSRSVEYKEVLLKPRALFVINKPGILFNFIFQIRSLKFDNLISFYSLMKSFIVIITSTLSVIYISPYLFFFFLCIVVINLETLLYTEELKRKNTYKASFINSQVSKKDMDTTSNTPLVQEALKVDMECEKIFYRGKYTEKINNKIRFFDLRNHCFLQIIVDLLSTMVVAYFIIYDIIATKDIGRFALITSATSMFSLNFKELSRHYTQMESNRNQVIDVEKKISLPKALERKTGNKVLQTMDDTITLNNVEFSYPKIKDITIFGEEKIERGNIVIDGISTKITKGGVTAVVGASGQGKTTLMSLIRHDYDLTSGSIKLGDKDITELSDEAINKQISFIEQRVQFFDNTLLYNLKYFNDQATDEEVKRALASAGLTEDISRLKDGLHHRVGQFGGALSGGQRQRLALARIFLTDRPIMILDEPTTGLDQVLSFKVMKALKEKAKNKTVLLVTHNPTEIALADRIIVIKNGKIESDGTPLELVQDSPFIKACLTKQDILSKQELFSKIS